MISLNLLKHAGISIFLIMSLLVNAHAETNGVALSSPQKAIIPIAAFTANGDAEQLKRALESGLDGGLSVYDIREILIQMYAYAGFPRSLTGHAIFMDVLEDREKRGLKDPIGQGPALPAADADKRALGARIQTELVGHPVSGPIYEFSPAMDAFLKEHLFYDIFGRGVLTNQERELATVAALAALPAPAQLASHLNVCLNTGLTPAQLRDYVVALSEQVSPEAAKLASELLEKNLKNRRMK